MLEIEGIMNAEDIGDAKDKFFTNIDRINSRID